MQQSSTAVPSVAILAQEDASCCVSRFPFGTMPVQKRPAQNVAAAPGTAAPTLLAQLDAEDDNSQGRTIYLVTFARILPDTVVPAQAPALLDPSGWSREAVRDAMLEACAHP